MPLYETTIRTDPEGDANELQSLYQSYFPGQTLSPADIDYYTKAGGINALLQEFEGLKPIVQPTINVQSASPVPSADNWMSGVIFDQSKLPANFDWQNYLTRYSDLGAAGIDTPLEAQRHYALYGSTEGRQFAPEAANQDAVKNLYQSVLGREADPGGLAYWASQFGADVSPEEEAAFRQAAQAEIAARPPAGGLGALIQTQFGQNLTPEQLKARIGNLIPANATQEFFSASGTPAATGVADNSASGLAGTTVANANTESEEDRLNRLVDEYSSKIAERDLGRPLTEEEKSLFGGMFGAEDYRNYVRGSGEGTTLDLLQTNPLFQKTVSNIRTGGMEAATLDRYRNDPYNIQEAESLLGRPLTEQEKLSFGQFLYPTYESLNGQDTSAAILAWARQSMSPEDVENKRQKLKQSLLTEYDALGQQYLNRPLMEAEKQALASIFNAQDLLDPEGLRKAKYDALDSITSRSIQNTTRNNLIQNWDEVDQRVFAGQVMSRGTGTITYDATVNAANALRGYGIMSLDEVGIKAVPNPNDPTGQPFYQYYNKWDGTNIGAPTADGQLKIARDDRGIKGGTDVTMYYGQDGQIQFHGTEDKSNLWDTIHAAIQAVALSQLGGGIVSGIGGAGAGIAAVDTGGLAALGEGAGAAGVTGATTSSSLANAALNVGVNTLIQAAQGVDPVTALKNSVISAGTGAVANQFASMIPSQVADVGKSAVTQLITTGKIDPLSLATAAGVSTATDALMAETGIDRTTATKLVNAGVQLIRGNEVGALTSLGEAGISQLTSGSGSQAKTTSPASTKTGDVIDEYNVVSGGLPVSANPTEDEQIALQQRVIAANQAISDYLGPGNDLSREGLVRQLTNLVGAEQANILAAQADTTINQRRVSADVINRYSQVDPEFGTPLLDRKVAVKELEAVGFDTAQANDILDGVERQVAAARTAALNTAAQNLAAIAAGAGEFAGADQRAAIAAGAGEFAGADTARATNEAISNAKTFGEAYATARQAYGSGATFNWNGKLYSTDTFQENPALGLVPVAGSGRGTATGKTAEQEAALNATAEELRKIDPVARAALVDPASIDYGAVSPEGNTQGLSQTAADKLVQSLIPVDAIKTAFGMTTEAAGNTAKAIGTVGEALGFNTAQMSDFGRKLENIAQEMYPQALKQSEDEVKARFASAKSGADLATAIKDSVFNNFGAVAKMIGVEGIQELPNIALAVATGGAYGAVRYAGLLAGLGLDVIESAGLQGAQKVEEGLAKGLSRAAAVKGAVDDMKTAGVVTTLMTAAADKVPFGGTIAKTLIKGSASEGAEEYVIARATGADHMSALRQAAFGAMIGGPTEASLQGAGNLTSVVINGDAMVGTYADGTKVTITEPAGATELKIDVSAPSVVAGNVTSTITSDLNSGVDLNTAINNVVIANAGSDLSGTVDGTLQAVINSGSNVSTAVADLTSAASTATGNASSVINTVVSSLASNNVDLNANAGSVVSGALSSGSSVTTAVTDTLAAITNNGGTANGAATSIIDAVSNQTGGDASAVTSAGSTIIASSNGDKGTVTTVITAAANATNGSTEVVGNLVGDAAKTGNSDTTAAAVNAAITSTNGAGTEVSIDSALNNGADANTVLSTASNTLVATGGDTSAAVTSVVNAGLSNNVDTGTAVSSAVTGAVAAGGDTGAVVNAAVNSAVTSAARTKDYSAYSNMFADKQAATSAQRSDLEAKFAAFSEAADAATRTFNGTVYPTVEARNAAMNAFYSGTETASTGPTTKTSVDTNNQVANLSDVISLLSKMGITPTNSMVADLTANNATNAQVIQNLQNNAEIKAIMDGRVASQVTAAVGSAVSSAITAGGNTKAAVGGAIDGAVNAGANINDATSASVSATIVSSVTSGGDTNTSITDAVSGAVSNDAASNLGGNTTLLAAADSALSMASVTNLDTNQVVTSVIDGAVNGGVDTATAISSTVVTAVNQGNDPNTIVQAVTSSNPTASVDVDTTGTSTTVTTQNDNVTSSVTIDNTSGVTTTVNVDGNTNTATVTEVDTSSGTTTQTTITSNGSVTTNTNFHVIPPPVSTTGTPTSGTPTSGTPTSTATTTGPTVTEPEVTAPTVTPPAVTTPEQTTKTTTPKTTAPSSAGAGMLAAAALSGRKSPEDWLGGKLLQSKELGKYYDPLAGVFDTRLPVVPEVPETPVQEEEMRLPYYTYGQEPSMDEIFGEIPVGVEEEEPVYRMGGQVMNPQFMYAKGGLPRQDFRDGKHVAGPGDGQSDDIPAMLADGEFVFPADVVAALGNGSTKAGTEKLYEMMHAIRQRARSNKPKDLPPPALKSPLDYLKKR